MHTPARPTPRASIDALKLERLRALLGEILPHNAFYAAKLSRLNAATALESLDQLGEWPFTFKEELVAGAAQTGLALFGLLRHG